MKLRNIFLTLTLLWASSIYANTVSNLQGKLSVNSGTLNYDIPLNLPVGTAGVKPSVSLSYSSNGANAYFGVGWNITGLSAISRCGSNFAFDTKRRGVKYDNEDNICLNGQRLVLVSGTKWGSNSEYRTKIDSYSKIIYDGEDFKVLTKAGDIKEYSLINRNWFLTKISDRYENSVDYNYFSNSSEVYLQDITYADNKVQLNYESKKDVFYGFSNGTDVRLTQRVKSIDVKSTNTILRTYKLEYEEQSSIVDKSILKSLTECSTGSCLEPLEFEYTQSENKLTPSGITPKTQSISAIYLDFNGDSYVDVYDNNQIAYGYKSDFGSGKVGFMAWKSTGTNVKNDEIKFADFDGDGDIDFIVSNIDTYINDSRGNFTKTNSGVIGKEQVKDMKLADFNTDGYIDIYINDTIYLRNSNGIFTKYKKLNLNLKSEEIYFLDMNNDGYTDIYEIKSGTHNIYFNDGSATFKKTTITGMSQKPENLKLADVNGDGLIDVYQINYNESDLDIVFYNKGNGAFSPTMVKNLNISPENFRFVDINGDGVVDIYETRSEDDKIWINNGTGNFTSKSYSVAIDCTQDKMVFADINGDGLVDVIETDSSNQVWFNETKKTKLISVTDSFENKTGILYKRLNEMVFRNSFTQHENILGRTIAPALRRGNIYHKKHSDASYPTIDLQTAQEVVSSITSTASNETPMITTYKYEGLKANLKGLGSLGFAKVTSTNELSNLRTETNYNQEYPYIGLAKENNSYLEDELVSQTTYEYSNTLKDGVYQLQSTSQTSKSYENSQLLKTMSVNNSDFDKYGNVKNIITKTVDETTGEEFTKEATNTYINNSSKWILARLLKAEVTTTAYGDSKTKTSSFTYDSQTGILKTETIEPSSSKWLKKSYEYDTHGNKIKESISGADIPSRDTTTFYDPLGKFATKITNALGHSESREYNTDGQLLKLTSPNGLVTAFTYDSFGKKSKETRDDATSTTYSYEFDSSLPLSYYSITVKSDGVPAITTYFSKLNQELRTTKTGFDGKIIIEEIIYDAFGNITQKSSPYSEGETPEYAYMTYDKYQRVVTTDVPATNNQRDITTTSYDGYSMNFTNAKGQVKTTAKNVLGNVVKVQEEENAYQLYSYDALGNLITTIDSQGNKIVLEYDIFGNKTYQNDPDMGEWSYNYNSLGQLVSQTDAKGQITTLQYDTLGRKISENIAGVISTWEYDTTKKGKLHSESKPNFNRVYSYDNFLRLSSTTTIIDSNTFTKSFTYDAYGRLDTKSLPKNFKLENVYNEYGYLEAIKSPKAQIKDFDPDHFVVLIEKTLDDAIDSYKKSLEYQEKAKQLKDKAAYYTKIATHYENYKEYYLSIAKRLDSYAQRYEYYAQRYKSYADYYKRVADGYLLKANRGYDWHRHWFSSHKHYYSPAQRAYYKRLSDIYNQYSTRYAHWSNYYLNIAQIYSNMADNYESYANRGDYYLNLAKSAIKQSEEAVAIAENYSQRSDDGYTINIAYQEILDDSEYNYFYKVLKQDSYGRVTQYLSGNGLITTKEYDNAGALNHIKTGYNFDDAIRELNFEYDLVSNVTSREDKKLGVSQAYEYDSLNRVVSATNSTLDNFTQLNYTYDSIGNMTSKSDIGSYTYSSSNPHQVLNAGDKGFTYDLNGNMINNNGTLMEYTAFNKVSKLTTPTDTINFSYDTNKNRYKKSSDKETSFYIDKSYEQTIKQDNSVEDKYFIYVGSKVMSIYTDSNAAPSTKYLHYDSLNSVDTITNNLGVVESRMAYKPFGEKLNLDKDGKQIVIALHTNRGYTGHEHIQETNLINMNGRVYDPSIARFISADPYIQDPYDTQIFNRYSYVKNNPLKYTDPSGFNVYYNGGGGHYGGGGGNSNYGNKAYHDNQNREYEKAKAAREEAARKKAAEEAAEKARIAEQARVAKEKARLQQTSIYSPSPYVSQTGGMISYKTRYNTPNVNRGSANTIFQSSLSGTMSRTTGGKFANGASSASFGQAVHYHIYSDHRVQALPSRDELLISNVIYTQNSVDRFMGNAILTVGGGGMIGIGVRTGYKMSSMYLMRNPKKVLKALYWAEVINEAVNPSTTPVTPHGVAINIAKEVENWISE